MKNNEAKREEKRKNFPREPEKKLLPEVFPLHTWLEHGRQSARGWKEKSIKNGLVGESVGFYVNHMGESHTEIHDVNADINLLESLKL